jgi:hypothetical protein
VSRDNICKTQCSFALNSPSNGFFDPSSDQLQAPLAFVPAGGRPLNNGNGNGPITQPIRSPFPSPFSDIRAPAPPAPPNVPIPPRPPRPPQAPISFTGNAPVVANGVKKNVNNNNNKNVAGSAQGAVNANGSKGNRGTSGGNANQQTQQVNPNRQPRPLFNFLPRLPNLSEIFGL